MLKFALPHGKGGHLAELLRGPDRASSAEAGPEQMIQATLDDAKIHTPTRQGRTQEILPAILQNCFSLRQGAVCRALEGEERQPILQRAQVWEFRSGIADTPCTRFMFGPIGCIYATPAPLAKVRSR